MHVAIYYGSRADEGTLQHLATRLEKKMEVSKWVICPDALWTISPSDLAFVLGDRIETLETVCKLNLLGIPIAHLAGGDITEGSQDDCFRHAITKLSHLHFPTHPGSAARIIQMGEQPDRVHMVGAVNVDRVLATQLLTKEVTFDILHLPVPDKFILVCLHPNTLRDPGVELKALACALSNMHNVKKILIGPNLDKGAKQVIDKWIELDEKPDFSYFDNLPQRTYLSLLKHCNVLVGNSSAGFTEAPVFGTPVVNIGDRQGGRPLAPCITNAEPLTLDIIGAMSWALHISKHPFCSQYGDGHAAEKIADIVSKIADPKALLRKQWYVPKT